MSTCICGREYRPTYSKDSLDLCPHCLAASNGGGYMSSKEWVCGNVTDDSGNEVNSDRSKEKDY